MSETSPQPFAHLGAPNCELYRSVMRVFVANRQRFVVHLRPEDIREQIAAAAITDDADIEAALRKLEEWDNLRSTPDTARVTSVDEFYRIRLLYQLTRAGEVAERAIEFYEQQIGERGQLQAVALEDIRLRLRSLHELPPDPDPAVVHSLLRELSSRLEDLASNATAFMGGLQRAIDLHELGEEAFLAYKDRLVAYLERFVSELVIKAHDIASMLGQISPERVEELLRIAAEREARDDMPLDAPVAEEAGVEPAPDPVVLALDRWRERWSGLVVWFVGDRAHPSQASLLRQRARKAIPDLLATVSLLLERRAGRSDRSADFRELARWFAQADDDEAAHRLWRGAFGLASARHLTGASASDADPATSWADAPPVEISPRLRATGRYQRRGRPARVVDRSQERELLQQRLVEERHQLELARARLCAKGSTTLDALGQLDRSDFRLLLGVLGEALAAGPTEPDGSTRIRTADGSMHVVMRPRAAGQLATIHTPDGILRGPDHDIAIHDTRPGSEVLAR